MTAPNFTAGGTVHPCRFVVWSDSNEVIEASAATSWIQGVSQDYARTAPIPGATVTAAEDGDQLKVYGVGDICLLEATTAGWTAGDRLTANASGQGIQATTTNYYGAVALTTLTGAGLGRVQVILGKNP